MLKNDSETDKIMARVFGEESDESDCDVGL